MFTDAWLYQTNLGFEITVYFQKKMKALPMQSEGISSDVDTFRVFYYLIPS